MKAEIICVGTELLLGDIVNTNAQFLAQELASLGFGVYYQTVVGDNPQRLAGVVKEAKGRSDILIFTGGLGPTDDDLTKQTVASVFEDELVMDEEELEKIRGFFINRGITMTTNNEKQAMVPRNGEKIPNFNGTAPGMIFKHQNSTAFLIPGPPSEMRPMFTNQIRPMLEAMQDGVLYSHTLRVFGIGESLLEDMVHPLLDGRNPTAALYAKTGEVHVRITARAQSELEAVAMCEDYAGKFRALLNGYIYTETWPDLETTLVRQLQERAETIATAESCTGGLLSKRITSVAGASDVFGYGACTYANTAKVKMIGVPEKTLEEYGAVSAQTAAAMAQGIQTLAGATYGVGITGVAGPDGGTTLKPVGLVYVAASSLGGTFVKKLQLGAHRNREWVRHQATQYALDMVRRLSLGMEIEDAEKL